MNEEKIVELIKWLKGEKYLIDEKTDTTTEEFENSHLWEISRNIMIEKTINKINELINYEQFEASNELNEKVR